MISKLTYSPNYIDEIRWLSDTQLVLRRSEYYTKPPDYPDCITPSKIQVSILDIQSSQENIVFEGYGDAGLTINEGKIYFIGGETPCPVSSYEFDSLNSILSKIDLPPDEQGVLYCQTKSPNNIITYLTMDIWHPENKSIYILNETSHELAKKADVYGFSIGFTCVEKQAYFWTGRPNELVLSDDYYFQSGIYLINLSTSQIISVAGNPESNNYSATSDVIPIQDFLVDFSGVMLIGATKSGSIIVLGTQSGNTSELSIINPYSNAIKRLGDEVFWKDPTYRGESSDGYLAIEATDIESNTRNIYILNSEGNLIQTIENAQLPIWIP